jgi:hypothetical protein
MSEWPDAVDRRWETSTRLQPAIGKGELQITLLLVEQGYGKAQRFTFKCAR